MTNAAIFILGIALLFSACGGSVQPPAPPAPEADRAPEPSKGAHGGRLLRQGDFALEVKIFEDGVPPEYRLYGTWQGKPVALQNLQASIQLDRFTGQDQHRFTAKADYLHSPLEVYEPHSFVVKVNASYQGQSYSWQYDSFEGRTALTADSARAAGVQVAAVQGGTIAETLSLYGQVMWAADQKTEVTARFAGPIRSVRVQVGDVVEKGQTLATVESNDSLQVYAITAPQAGRITQRHANVGEVAGSTPLFEIGNDREVMAELPVFARDRPRVKAGQAVRLWAADNEALQETTALTALQILPEGTQARIRLNNADNRWTLGQWLQAEVTVAQSPAAVVVPLSALQTFRNWDVVFLNQGDTYQAQPITLGRKDGVNAEVLSGLSIGQSVVVTNSYLIKADIEKAGASHDH